MNLQKLAVSFAFVLLAASVSQAITWKGLFIAGDDSIENFDNGREDLTAMFSKLGTLNSLQLSSSSKFISPENHVAGATINNINAAFGKLRVNPADGCLIHMTSHGAKGQGFYLSKAGILPPSTLEKFVTYACGDAPTVILISACYSGQFITESIKAPNRIILTAARADRPSFGCSADTRYTYWDECLLQELPSAKTWENLYPAVKACISDKEKALGEKPSEPQAFFGENTHGWEILH